MTDFCINNILNDQFTYMADNVYQYYIGNHNSYYLPTNRNCDLAYIRQKWHMNYINTIPSSNLISMINEPIDKELNVLEMVAIVAQLYWLYKHFIQTQHYMV